MGKNKIIIRPIQPLVYEFTHPGDEHTYDSKLISNIYIKGWNLVEKPGGKVTHRRKYIRSDGKYIDIYGEEKCGKLDFWGEWEPDSIAKKIATNGKNDLNPQVLPNWIHYPFFLNADYLYNVASSELGRKISEYKNEQYEMIKRDKRYLQNTDPFVYGKAFMYSSICKPEQTLDLKSGSIILFGSCKKYKESPDIEEKTYKFRVDTIFVIKEILDFSDEVLNSYRNTIYYEAALKYINAADGFSHKLFIGATPKDSFNGMYSFIPAHISSDTPYGQMVIDNTKDVFKEVRYTQSVGREVAHGEKSVKRFWESLLNYTYDSGYVPATHIELPPTFNTPDEIAYWINNQ